MLRLAGRIELRRGPRIQIAVDEDALASLQFGVVEQPLPGLDAPMGALAASKWLNREGFTDTEVETLVQ